LVILCPKSAGTPTCCWLPQLSTIASIETRARMAAKATERNLLLTIRSFLYIPLQMFSRGMILPAPHELPGSPATVVSSPDVGEESVSHVPFVLVVSGQTVL
jgi:hypothetical protein